jgi:hypothetical protein
LSHVAPELSNTLSDRGQVQCFWRLRTHKVRS